MDMHQTLDVDVDHMDMGQMLAEISRLHRGPLQGKYLKVGVTWLDDGGSAAPGHRALRVSHTGYPNYSDRFSDQEAAAEWLIAQLRRDVRDGEAK